MKIKGLVLLILLSFSQIAGAEGGCPPGMYPPNPSNTSICYPFPDTQSNPPAQVQAPAKPQGRWETRWGAIAMSSSGVITYAGVVNFSTKQSAQKAAIARCNANGGGKSCKVGLAFYNQCGVIASGDTATVMQGGATIEIASGMGLKKCSKDTTNCKIYYADCSPPAWISY